jgi:hypothetical protein
MVIEVSEEQCAKAPFPILVTPLGISNEVNAEQPLNIPHPISFTLSGRVIDSNEEQS